MCYLLMTSQFVYIKLELLHSGITRWRHHMWSWTWIRTGEGKCLCSSQYPWCAKTSQQAAVVLCSSVHIASWPLLTVRNWTHSIIEASKSFNNTGNTILSQRRPWVTTLCVRNYPFVKQLLVCVCSAVRSMQWCEQRLAFQMKPA